MASTTGTNYFTKSMNSIIEIDDGSGTTISDGNINCNSFTTSTFSTTTLNTTTLTNTGTLTSNIINATTSASIPTLNTTTLTNTGTLTSNILNASTSASIPIVNSTTINNTGQLNSDIVNSNTITTSTSTLNIGSSGTSIINMNANNLILKGSGSVQLNPTGTGTTTIGNASSGVIDITGSTINLTSPITNISKSGNYMIEATASGGNAFLDFHSSNTSSNYDSRIIATGGSSTVGQGTLNLQAGMIQLYSSPFRFIPWTQSYGGTSISTIINSTVSVPTSNANALVKYRYSVVGNSMYINFYFNQVNAGTTGSGFYSYSIPNTGLLVMDMSLLQISNSVVNGNNGTRVGSVIFHHFGVDTSIGGVYVDVNKRMLLWSETYVYSQQSSSYYNYATTNFNVSFEAIIPITT